MSINLLDGGHHNLLLGGGGWARTEIEREGLSSPPPDRPLLIALQPRRGGRVRRITCDSLSHCSLRRQLLAMDQRVAITSAALDHGKLQRSFRARWRRKRLPCHPGAAGPPWLPMW